MFFKWRLVTTFLILPVSHSKQYVSPNTPFRASCWALDVAELGIDRRGHGFDEGIGRSFHSLVNPDAKCDSNSDLGGAQVSYSRHAYRVCVTEVYLRGTDVDSSFHLFYSSIV